MVSIKEGSYAIAYSGSWLPSSGREERTKGQDSTGELVAVSLSPASGQMFSFLILLTGPSLGTKRLKVHKAEFRGTSNTERGAEAEEEEKTKTTPLSNSFHLLITPSIES